MLPKRCSALDVRRGTEEELDEWEAMLRHAIAAAEHGAGRPDLQLPPPPPISAASPSASGAPPPPPSSSPPPPRLFARAVALVLFNGGCLLAHYAAGTALLAAAILCNLAIFALVPPTPPPPPLQQRPPEARRTVAGAVRPKAGAVCGAGAVLARSGDAAAFSVRCGPDYPRRGLKAPSGPAIYELAASDFGRAPARPRHIAELMQLPAAAEGPGRLPALLVVSIVTPVAAPTLYGEPETADCVVAAFCFRCTEAAQAASREAQPGGAVEMLARFSAEAAEKRMEAGAFKIIAQAANWGEIGLPSAMRKFNGKPVLIRKSAELYLGASYVEIDVFVDRFSFLAKRGLHSVKPQVKHADIELAFLLQATADADLPERVLACVRIPHLEWEALPAWPAAMCG